MRLKNQLPTQEYLLSILEYRDGQLFWKAKTSNKSQIKIGDIAGTINNITGYITICLNRVQYLVHRLIWKILTGKDPKFEIDHINHNKTDNRIENLREVSSQQNSKNRSIMKNNTSGYCNISFRSKSKYKKFQVFFNIEKYFKSFLTLEEAIQHRNEKYIEFGFHKNHGLT